MPVSPTIRRAPVEVNEYPYTVADLAAMPAELPTGTRCYELDNGRLISMAPPGDLHGAVELCIAAQLKFQGDLRGHGKARSGEVGIVLWRNPDRVVGADAVFIANASLPIRRSPEGYLETIPELVLEVVSRNDTRPYVLQKVSDYLFAGVRVVWVADHPTRTVTEYRSGREPLIYHDEDVITIEDLIPGFRMHVTDAFEE
jgi:Uma2 family endonuclease